MVLTAMLFAAAMVLSFVENSLPPLPITIPGVKFGLSNIAVMYALFFINVSSAFTIAVLKAGFTVMTRGAVAGLLSLTGGLLSVIIMLVLLRVFKDKLSYFALSMSGAVSHNIGQYMVVSMINPVAVMWYYLPVLLISGILAGLLTSVLLKFILPAFKKLDLK